LYSQAPKSSFTGNYQYRYTSPYRMTVGAMLLFGKLGFINVDAEVLDYATTRLNAQSATDRYFDPANAFMRANFQQAYNYRIGGELRFDAFRVRGGYALYGSAQKAALLDYKLPDGSSKSLSAVSEFISGGLGYKKDNFFMDLSVMYNLQQDGFTPYTNAYNAQTNGYNFVPTVANTATRVSTTFTIGFTFGGKQTPSYSVGGMTSTKPLRGDMAIQP
jgi:hypothetical protein